jgi:predicted CoA-binding protein
MTEHFENPSSEEIRDLLEQIKTIAVVGLSNKSHRPSYRVAKALQDFGYRIIPVNPTIDEVLGEKAYSGLSEVPDAIDLVDVFRASQYVAAIVENCIDLKLPALWLQEGVVDEEAALRAQEAGMKVVMDRCIYKEYA